MIISLALVPGKWYRRQVFRLPRLNIGLKLPPPLNGSVLAIPASKRAALYHALLAQKSISLTSQILTLWTERLYFRQLICRSGGIGRRATFRA